MTEQAKRYFRYIGPPVHTREPYGVRVVAAHTRGDGFLYVWDPDVGDVLWGTVECAVRSGQWIEVTRKQWVAL